MQVPNCTVAQRPLQPAKAKPGSGVAVRLTRGPGREGRRALRRRAVETGGAAPDASARPHQQRQRQRRRGGGLELADDEHVVVRDERADLPGAEAVAAPAREHAPGHPAPPRTRRRRPTRRPRRRPSRSPPARAASRRAPIRSPCAPRRRAPAAGRTGRSRSRRRSARARRRPPPPHSRRVQPANSEPSAGSGVSCTLVPNGSTWTQSGGQAVPPTASRTTPTPLPPVATDRRCGTSQSWPTRSSRSTTTVSRPGPQASSSRTPSAASRASSPGPPSSRSSTGAADEPVRAGAADAGDRSRRRRAGGRRPRRRAGRRCRRRRRCGPARRDRRCGRGSPSPPADRRAASRASRPRPPRPAGGPAGPARRSRPATTDETRPW